MAHRDIVVMGGSAGAIQALQRLAAGFLDKFPAPIFVVVHVPAEGPSTIPDMLNRAGPLQAVHAQDGERFTAGRIYVAPPDRHLLLEHDRVLVRKGPKENRFRPSIDALFRSAAYVYGSRVVGVVLSGALDDGTSGLWTVKHRGGIAVVQEPSDAQVSSMPESALQHVKADHIVPVAEMPALLHALVASTAPRTPPLPAPEKKKLELETHMAMGESGFEAGIMSLGTPSAFTCPECHGALAQLREGKLTRYRCHVGHAFSAHSLLAGINESVENTLWQSLQQLEEAMLLLEHLAGHAAALHEHEAASAMRRKARDTESRALALRALIEEAAPVSVDPGATAAAQAAATPKAGD